MIAQQRSASYWNQYENGAVWRTAVNAQKFLQNRCSTAELTRQINDLAFSGYILGTTFRSAYIHAELSDARRGTPRHGLRDTGLAAIGIAGADVAKM
jgi:hypothetical protein